MRRVVTMVCALYGALSAAAAQERRVTVPDIASCGQCEIRFWKLVSIALPDTLSIADNWMLLFVERQDDPPSAGLLFQHQRPETVACRHRTKAIGGDEPDACDGHCRMGAEEP